MTKQQKRNLRNTRILQKMWMQEQARGIDSRAAQISMARTEALSAPDYKTPAYETLHDFLSSDKLRKRRHY